MTAQDPKEKAGEQGVNWDAAQISQKPKSYRFLEKGLGKNARQMDLKAWEKD